MQFKRSFHLDADAHNNHTQAEEEEFKQHLATYHAVNSIVRHLTDGTDQHPPQILLCFNLFCEWSGVFSAGCLCFPNLHQQEANCLAGC